MCPTQYEARAIVIRSFNRSFQSKITPVPTSKFFRLLASHLPLPSHFTLSLQLFGQPAMEFSGSLPQAQRLAIITQMKRAKSSKGGGGGGDGDDDVGDDAGDGASATVGTMEQGRVLVCSDAMARGMDVASVVSVISPASCFVRPRRVTCVATTTYPHRAPTKTSYNHLHCAPRLAFEDDSITLFKI